VSRESLQSRLQEMRSQQRRPQHRQGAPPATTANRPKLPPWERELIELLLISPEAIDRLAAHVDPQAIEDELARGLYVTCLELYECGTAINIESLLTACEDADIKSLLVTLEAASQAKQQSDTAQRISDVINTYRKRLEGDQLRADMAALGAANLSETQQQEILENLFTRLKNRQSPEPF